MYVLSIEGGMIRTYGRTFTVHLWQRDWINVFVHTRRRALSSNDFPPRVNEPPFQCPEDDQPRSQKLKLQQAACGGGWLSGSRVLAAE